MPHYDFNMPVTEAQARAVKVNDTVTINGTLYGMLCGFSFEACPHLDERDVRRLEMAAHATARLIAQAEGRDIEPLAMAH